MDIFEKVIIKNLIANEEYAKKITPFIHREYVEGYETREIIDVYKNHVNDYKSIPSFDELCYKISTLNLDSENIKNIMDILMEIKQEEIQFKSLDFLVDQTEEYFQYVKMKEAIIKGSKILNDPNKKHERHEILHMMKESLKISIDDNIGDEYATEKDVEDQFTYYHTTENRFPFYSWKQLNKVMKGGSVKEALHIGVAGTGVGKTTFLTNVADQYAQNGYDVLYITLEIPKNQIKERFDLNKLDMTIDEIMYLEKDHYKQKILKLKETQYGRIFVKEYPMSTINVNTIRFLLDELEMKENFKPTVLIIDQMNLMLTMKNISISDSYAYYKIVSEEIKGLLQEKKMIGWTVQQLNREGINNSDPNLKHMSSSIGPSYTADFIFMIIETSEMKEMGRYLLKFVKSRYQQIKPSNETIIIGVDKDKQKIFEISENEKNEYLKKNNNQIQETSSNMGIDFSKFEI